MWGLWAYLTNAIDRYLNGKKGKLLFLGLENAGKTTLLHMLKEGRAAQLQPTHYATCEELRVDGLRLTTFDVGGHIQARRVWKDYFPAIDAIVFLVDAAKVEKLEEARNELWGVLGEAEIADIPVLVLGNKVDKPSALPEAQLKDKLGLTGLTTGKGKVPRSSVSGRPLEVFMSSIVKEHGYGDGIRWLSQYLD